MSSFFVCVCFIGIILDYNVIEVRVKSKPGGLKGMNGEFLGGLGKGIDEVWEILAQKKHS